MHNGDNSNCDSIGDYSILHPQRELGQGLMNCDHAVVEYTCPRVQIKNKLT